MQENIDDDFFDLIIKRRNSNKNHWDMSKQLFKELTELSKLPIIKFSKKL